mmetsp:Transcript_37964/g.57243  ORF Transcript_37964/g.57243 Transcript_37964/m.57243 type:complete len:167 (-) Transcript_37964:319-819(-)|eukprot:CAMPEP_0206460712 /NCGR_PEP_ID=MMETSP0324_2-20121206/24905_1 /ASSEMBLY_ACC=CAM_ASM_000836 /TAXON_ID=2866 /ORGANISM="Crypthecodinium cohnii, Strain Seligo" /LENGTH=166 /DNA_ID=CAMNT_0053932447 /DNA_START=90 /DNA_END=590 /DNA_ORIENTATION=-
MAKLGGNLDEFIDKALLECLNQDEGHAVVNAFEDNDEFLASDKDVDSELLVKVQFRQPIKLSGIKVLGGPEDDTAPQSVKIFEGKENIGFAEAGDEEAKQELQLEAEATQGDGSIVPVRFVKFQMVRTLQLYFPDAGNDQTQVRRIQFFGEPAEKMDMKEWKPIKG